MHWHKACIVGLLASLTVVGCDKKENRPETPSDPKSISALDEQNRPTPQELLQGKQKNIAVGFFPLTVDVPDSWKTETMNPGAMVFLQGPAPKGDIKIQLLTRGTMSPERLNTLVIGAKQEMNENPETIKRAELRTLGTLKLFERQSVGKPIEVPMRDAKGNRIDQISPLYSWTINVFVPRSTDMYEVYELNFIGMSADEYQADKILLQRIIDSIKPAPSPK